MAEQKIKYELEEIQQPSNEVVETLNASTPQHKTVTETTGLMNPQERVPTKANVFSGTAAGDAPPSNLEYQFANAGNSLAVDKGAHDISKSFEKLSVEETGEACGYSQPSSSKMPHIGYTSGQDTTDTEDGAWAEPGTVANPVKRLPPLPLQYSLKHPLAMPWTLWMFVKNGGSWQNNQVEIATFDTIEDFWSLYSHTKLPGDLQPGRDYSIFREGIKPMWEDQNNTGGGRWIVPFSTSLRHQQLNQLWVHLVLAVLGESFPQTHEVCGVVVNIREKRDKIAMWTKCAKRDRNNKAIGYYLKAVLNVPVGMSIKYYAHCDAETPQKFMYCL